MGSDSIRSNINRPRWPLVSCPDPIAAVGTRPGPEFQRNQLVLTKHVTVVNMTTLDNDIHYRLKEAN